MKFVNTSVITLLSRTDSFIFWVISYPPCLCWWLRISSQEQQLFESIPFQQVRFSSNAAWIVYLSDFRVVHLNRITRWQDQSYLKMTRIMCIGHATNVNLRWPQLDSDLSTGGPHNLFRLLFYSNCPGFTVCFTYSDVSLTMCINQWEINVELPCLRCIVVLLSQKRFFERFWMMSSPLTVPYNRSKR